MSSSSGINEIYRKTDTLKGAKAASKRERKEKDAKVAKSQLKVVRNPLRLHFRTGYTLIYGHY